MEIGFRFCGAFVLSLALLTGCGGGAKTAGSGKSLARERLLATTRIARHTFAMAGLTRHITRSPHARPRTRLQTLLATIQQGRDLTPGQDDGTGLYYALTTQSDGSGRQNLFTDSAHHAAAGTLAWSAPQWTGGKPNAYPARFHADYQIAAGDFAGDHGGMDVTAYDATGSNGQIHLTLEDAQHEQCVADIKIVNGIFTTNNTVLLADGTRYTEEDDQSGSDYNIACAITFDDGTAETITVQPDGSGDETLTAPDGQQEGTGSFDDSGMDTILYDDGTTDTEDVDTADE